MIDNSYLEFLKKIQVYFEQEYGLMGRELYLARVTKLTEEVGELAAEVLAYCNLQRSEKQHLHSQESLEAEWADAVGTLFLLGMALNIDMNKALKNRLKIIGERYQIDTNAITDN